jgi:hypothetical protein
MERSNVLEATRHKLSVVQHCCPAVRNMGYSQQERVFILERYFASKSFIAVREAFHRVYPEKEVPNKTTVHRLVKKLRETWSVCNRKHVRRRTVLTNDAVRVVHETLLRSPRKFLRRLSQECGTSKTSCHRATKQLKLLPSRFQSVHQLQERDKGARIQYCHWFRRFVREGINVLDNVFFSDEAWLHLNGYINSQNSQL